MYIPSDDGREFASWQEMRDAEDRSAEYLVDGTPVSNGETRQSDDFWKQKFWERCERRSNPHDYTIPRSKRAPERPAPAAAAARTAEDLMNEIALLRKRVDFWQAEAAQAKSDFRHAMQNLMKASRELAMREGPNPAGLFGGVVKVTPPTDEGE